MCDKLRLVPDLPALLDFIEAALRAVAELVPCPSPSRSVSMVHIWAIRNADTIRTCQSDILNNESSRRCAKYLVEPTG